MTKYIWKELLESDNCIYLQYKPLGDDQAILLSKALANNKNVTDLDLGGNNITDRGISAIAKALKINTRLEYLALYCNDISDEGAMMIAEVLKVNKGLIVLDLQYSNSLITIKGFLALAEAMIINKTLVCIKVDEFEAIYDKKKLLQCNTTVVQKHGWSRLLDIEYSDLCKDAADLIKTGAWLMKDGSRCYVYE